MIKQAKFRAILNEEAKNSGKYVQTVVEFTFEDLLRHKTVFYHPEHWIFLRSTGLFDKNGKEIFEGNTVRVLFGKDKKSRDLVVTWKNGGFHPKTLSKGHWEIISK